MGRSVGDDLRQAAARQGRAAVAVARSRGVQQPTLGARHPSGSLSPAGRRRFVRSTVVEVVVMVVIVGVTAALVAERPAKAHDRRGVRAGAQDTRIGPYDLNLVVDPARTGSNEIHLYLLTRSTGQPVDVDEIRASASLPAAGIGPLRFTATPAGPGHAVVTAAVLPLAGTWRFSRRGTQGRLQPVEHHPEHPNPKGNT